MRHFITFSFLWCCLHGTSQQPLYNFYKNFKVEDGLPQSFVSGIQQDKDGFIWIGSRDGLARYDGREFKIFRNDANDSTSISSNVIRSLYIDKQNLLWIFYINNRFECFDPTTLKVFNRHAYAVVQQLMTKYTVSSFVKDRQGNFWLNTNYKGIICINNEQGKITYFDSVHNSLNSNFNLGIAEANDGKMYGFTDKGVQLLAIDNPEKNEFIPYPENIQFHFTPSEFNKTATLSNGNLVLSQQNRVIIFQPETKTFSTTSFPAGNAKEYFPINHLQPFNNTLFAEKNGEVFRMEDDGSFSLCWKSPSTKTKDRSAISFWIDRSSVIWFGSNGEGLYKIDANALPFYSSPYHHNFHTDVLKLLNHFPANQLPVSISSTLWSYGFRHCYSPDGTLFFSSAESLNPDEKHPLVFVFKNRSLSVLPVPPDFHKGIRGLRFYNGILYAIDLDGNCYEWNDINAAPVYRKSVLNLQNNTAVTDLLVSGKTAWIATDKEGLFKVENYQLLKNFTKGTGANDLPTNQLTCIAADKKDSTQCWIGSLGQGLISWNITTAVKKIINTSNGLPNNTIYSILQDNNTNLWVSTNQGISRINTATNAIETFTVKDGLPGNEFNRFHHFLFPDGRMAFGGLDGFVVFNPGQFGNDNFQTPVAFTKLFINNAEDINNGNINTLNKLSLPYNKNFLQFEFAGLQMNQPEKIQYRYKLEGYDKDWINNGNRNIATYTRLPYGNYTLLINASNTSGQWSTLIKKLDIKILPPFWATWWAYIIYGLILAAMVLAFHNYRVNRMQMKNEIFLEHSKAEQLKEVDEMKNRFFDNITHEFRTPLTLILTPLQKLSTDANLSPLHRQTISNAHNNAEQLLKLINQLLDISRIEAGQMKMHTACGDLPDFVKRCVHQFADLANQRNINLKFSSKVEGYYYLDVEKWEKIIFNLLSNAIKFTSANGTISVELVNTSDSPHESGLQLSVNNTGTVISAEHLPRIFDRFYMADDSGTKTYSGTGIGLALVKELTEIMHGNIKVESNEASGTTFTVIIPLQKGEITTTGKPQVTISTSVPAADFVPAEGVHLEKPLVLVVEDNKELRLLIVGELGSHYRVIQAESGKTAFEMIFDELPEIVISDMMMPDMDGNELCRRIKKDSRTAHISFVMLTAKAAHQARIAGMEAGADVYMSKPFHFDELEMQLTNLLKQQENIRRHLQEQLLGKKPPEIMPHVSNEFLQSLYNILDEHLDDTDLNVEGLSQHLAMSRRTLSRKLDNLLHISPNELIRNYRLQKSAVLISAGHPISQTAYTVGFDSPSYFSQCFKELYGITPTEFAMKKIA